MSESVATQPDGPALTLSFEDIGLRVGTPLYMRSQDPGVSQTRYQVEYIGAIRGKSLLVTLPLLNGKGVLMPVGQEFVFHAVEGMYIYAFTSRVLRPRNSPVPYAHFAYPSRIDARQVRKSYRVRMRLPVAVAGGGAGGDARGDALLLDLSMTGALLEAPADAWREGDALSLVLPVALEEASSRLTLSAKVRNRAERPGGQAHYGVEFAELPQNDALLLHYYIDHAIAARIG
ncbi:MAG: flagellar brake protein [Hydrogenophilales bacterium]|nr:flagellar brake protein [Hydrogenophilales bacterium]MBP8902754.1 flagellar brake protein [Thiobacillaceae bacterium]